MRPSAWIKCTPCTCCSRLESVSCVCSCRYSPTGPSSGGRAVVCVVRSQTGGSVNPVTAVRNGEHSRGCPLARRASVTGYVRTS